ncbi:hypothetical protein PMAYCL1PPCAC_09669, partial [Pristionchus mayeri]
LPLAFLTVAASVANAHACKWYGTAPLCGSNDCPTGTTEIFRLDKVFQVYKYTGKFGKDCFSGNKTMCCRNEVVAKDPKKYCQPMSGLPMSCSKNQIPLADQFFVDIIRHVFCCDKGVLL